MTRQTGATLGGLMMFLLLLVLLIYTGSRVVPAYVDYWMVERTLHNLMEQTEARNGNEEFIRDQFEKQLRLNNISDVKRSDLLIERLPTGLRLTVTFSVKRPLVGAVSLCMDFSAVAGAGT
jgi:hypothetical protein